MIISFVLSAVFLGIIVAIPPGSVTVIACQRALQYGFKNSLFFTLGSCLSDIFYITVVYIGISNVIINNQYYKILLWIFCGSMLLFLGILSLLSLKKSNSDGNNVKKLQTNTFATFISGILITLTNPMTIIGWVAIAGNYFLIWHEKYPFFNKYMVVTIFLIMTGVLIWFIPLIYTVSKLKKIINEKTKLVILVLSNVCLIVFGSVALYYAYIDIVCL